MLMLALVAIAVIIGGIAARGDGRSVLTYVPAALVGALVGAFAAFGDAPFLLRYPIFNPLTFALMGAAIAVFVVRTLKTRKTGRH